MLPVPDGEIVNPPGAPGAIVMFPVADPGPGPAIAGRLNEIVVVADSLPTGSTQRVNLL